MYPPSFCMYHLGLFSNLDEFVVLSLQVLSVEAEPTKSL